MLRPGARIANEGKCDDVPDIRPASLHTEDGCGRFAGICQARNMLPMVCANTMRLTKGHAGGSRCRLRCPVRGLQKTSELFGISPSTASTPGPACRQDNLCRHGWRPQTDPAVRRQRLGFRNCSASLHQPPRFRVRLPGRPTYAAMVLQSIQFHNCGVVMRSEAGSAWAPTYNRASPAADRISMYFTGQVGKPHVQELHIV
jgi:hypothetical protein